VFTVLSALVVDGSHYEDVLVFVTEHANALCHNGVLLEEFNVITK